MTSAPRLDRLRRNPTQLSITRRLTLTFLGVGLVPLLTNQWMALEQFKRTLVLNHLQQTGLIAEAKREELEAFLAGSRRALEPIAQSASLRQELEGNPEPERAAAVLADALRSGNGPRSAGWPFAGLVLVDPTGKVVPASRDPHVRREPAAAALGQALRRQATTTPTHGATYLTVPVRGANGKPLGWLAGSIDNGIIRRLLNTHLLGLGRGARTELVMLQAHGNTLSLGPLSPEAGATTAASMERNLRFEPLDPDALRTRKPVQTDALDGRFRGADGQERIGSWRRLSLGKVGLLVSMERRKVLESATSLRTRLLTLMLLATGLVGAAGVLLGRSLTRPLLDLHTAVRDFDISNDGQLRPVAVKGHDEIAELANTINLMILGIQERTASLDRTNNRIQTYIQTVQTALLAIGNGGEITLLNEAGCRLLGFAPAG